jgi:iron(II)-dependent oxidoreductase
VLLREASEHIEEVEAVPAWKTLTEEMALIPAGSVPIVQNDGRVEMRALDAFYLDRHAVTNRQYLKFVTSGGYDQFDLWPEAVWPSLMRFTDRLGKPGPANWEGGRFPQGRADHPVVGVSWYEALAYSRWAGKRLPIAAEWQKAAGWPEPLGGMTRRYPWGDLFDPARANLWASGRGDTVAVGEYPEGATPNGIFQLAGNVWEWLEDPLDTIPCSAGDVFEPWRPLRRIHGGAFDTYLPSEATTHFITGQAELDRRSNIGFRCAVSVDQLRSRYVP